MFSSTKYCILRILNFCKFQSNSELTLYRNFVTTSCKLYVNKRSNGLEIHSTLDIDSFDDGKITAELSLDKNCLQGIYQRKKPVSEIAKPLHVPVMIEQVRSLLSEIEFDCKTFLDMTFGAGGHTRAVLDHLANCHIFALDRDPIAYRLASKLAKERPGRLTPLLGRFSDLPQLLKDKNIQPCFFDGVLLDLGSSSMQFDQPERGFSISMNGPLDMRMDGNRIPDQPTAADIVNSLDETDLAKIFKKYGEEKRSEKIAHAVVEARSAFGRIKTTNQLASIVDSICEGAYCTDKLGRHSHVATKVFQALRIFVNNEMNELNYGLDVANEYLKPGGICIAISFHSLEDRIVKHHFHSVEIKEEPYISQRRQKLKSSMLSYTEDQLEQMTLRKWEPLRRKVMVASEQEVNDNPRSRSAKLRSAIKVN